MMKNSMNLTSPINWVIQVENLLGEFLLKADDDKKKKKRPAVTGVILDIEPDQYIPRSSEIYEDKKRPRVTGVNIRKKGAGQEDGFTYTFDVTVNSNGYNGAYQIALSHNNNPEVPYSLGDFEITGVGGNIGLPTISRSSVNALFNINTPCTNEGFDFDIMVTVDGDSETTLQEVSFTYELEPLSFGQRIRNLFKRWFGRR